LVSPSGHPAFGTNQPKLIWGCKGKGKQWIMKVCCQKTARNKAFQHKNILKKLFLAADLVIYGF
jgi:hypothetical protein